MMESCYWLLTVPLCVCLNLCVCAAIFPLLPGVRGSAILSGELLLTKCASLQAHATHGSRGGGQSGHSSVCPCVCCRCSRPPPRVEASTGTGTAVARHWVANEPYRTGDRREHTKTHNTTWGEVQTHTGDSESQNLTINDTS